MSVRFLTSLFPSLLFLRSFQYNWGKRGQSRLWIGINPYVQPTESDSQTSQNQRERMIRPWVELEKDRYQRVNNLGKKTGRPISGMIRKAIPNFVRKKGYSIIMGPSQRPRTSRENYGRVTTYLSRSDLILLKSISKQTGRCKTHLIREAVNEYLSGLP